MVDTLTTPLSVYMALGITEKQRQTAYRGVLHSELGTEAIADIRLALIQNQALDNEWFHRKIENATGERREVRPRGGPRSAVGKIGSISGDRVSLGFVGRCGNLTPAPLCGEGLPDRG